MDVVLEVVVGSCFSAFLQVAFDRLASLKVINFFKRKELSDRLLKNLKLELNFAVAVLIDAEEKQITNSTVKKWLDDLKDVVYAADDLLDEIATEALRLNSEAEFQTGAGTKVRDLLSTFSDTFEKTIELELETILEGLEYIMKQKDVLGLKAFAGEVPPPPRQLTTCCPEGYGVYGRDIDREEIFKKLQSHDASCDEICVIPIVGMGGVGKTTLARLVYNDKRVKKAFDLKAWVCVSEKMDSFRIAKTILEDINMSNCDIQNLNLLQSRIRESLKGRKFLLILDDVWNENYIAWDELFRIFRCGAKKIKIIVTTRSEKVASIVCPFSPHHLKQLSDKECWLLFAKHAFENGTSSEYQDLEVIGKEIVLKCKGLPLAAKTLGGLLRSKQDPREWKRILGSDIWNLPEDESGIFPALRLSYHYLPSHLKQCFAYCSIFPKDYEFPKEQLVLLWMAEDLLQQSKGNVSVEEIGEQYFDDLVSRSFFQRSSNSQSCFIMHDLVNDLAKSIFGEFCFRLDIDNPCEMTKKTRHLSYFTTEFDTLRKFEVSCKAKGLRTFLGLKSSFEWSSRSNKITTTVIDDLVLAFKRLRVLSLSTYKNIRVSDSIGNLKHLRYLNLSSTNIKRLPDSVCTLYNLQTLLLWKCCLLDELPTNMGRLVNLRYLDIRETSLKKMPLQMGKLRSLHNLSNFLVGKHNVGSSIRELGELQHLSGKLSVSNLHHTRDAKEANLKDKKYLSELELEWGSEHDPVSSENEENMLKELCPHLNLKSLTIQYYFGTRFPDWLGDSSFSHMVSLKLSNCEHCCLLPPLGKLSALKELSIEGFTDLLEVNREFYESHSFTIKPFKSLETLTFIDMPQWKEWETIESEVFTTLQKLHIIRCPRLIRNLPNHLPSLTVLEVRDCQQLVTPLPRSRALHELHLIDCDNVQLKKLPPRLQSLTIGGCHTSLARGSLPTTLKSLVNLICKVLPRVHYYPSVESLEVQNGPDSLWSLQLELFPKLKRVKMWKCENLESLSALEGSHQDLTSLACLEIKDCRNFVSFPSGGLCASNLTKIVVSDCNKLESLPKGMHTLLPSLVALTLVRCPELISVANCHFPSNLQRLGIYYCDKLFPRVEWGLQGLHSLMEFDIAYEGREVDSFPDEELLPPTLIKFYISAFPHLKTLNGKGIQHLSSLKELSLKSCNELQRLPEENLPTSLSFLYIEDCPLLKERCQRNRRDWSKIAFIPYIEIDNEVISHNS